MNLMQLIVTIFDILWLCAALALLFLIWRASTRQTQLLITTLVDAAMKSATAAQTAAEAARTLAEQTKEPRQ